MLSIWDRQSSYGTSASVNKVAPGQGHATAPGSNVPYTGAVEYTAYGRGGGQPPASKPFTNQYPGWTAAQKSAPPLNQWSVPPPQTSASRVGGGGPPGGYTPPYMVRSDEFIPQIAPAVAAAQYQMPYQMSTSQQPQMSKGYVPVGASGDSRDAFSPRGGGASGQSSVMILQRSAQDPNNKGSQP